MDPRPRYEQLARGVWRTRDVIRIDGSVLRPTGWWTTGGVTPIAAWAPASAASESAAVADLTGKGYTLGRVGTTSFSSGSGISWTAAAGYLTTGVTPADTSVLVLLKVSGLSASSGDVILGCSATSPNRWIQVYAFGTGSTGHAMGTVVPSVYASRPASGVYGIGPGYGLIDGVVRKTWTQAGAAPGYAIIFGANNTAGTPGSRVSAITVRSAIICIAPTASVAEQLAAAMP